MPDQDFMPQLSPGPINTEGQRGQERFWFGSPLPCRLIPFDGTATRWVQLVNLSLTGIGMITSAPLAVGTLVQVLLTKQVSGAVCVLEAHIVHATPLEGRASFMIGASLTEPLAEEELRTLTQGFLG